MCKFYILPYMIDEAGELVSWKQVPILHGTRATTAQSMGGRHRQLGALTHNCKNVEAALKVMALMSTDDYYYRIMYGEPDVDSVRNEDGSFTFLDTPVGKAYSNNGTFFHNYYSVKESKDLRCARLEPTHPSYERFVCDIMNFYAPKEVPDPLYVRPYFDDYDDNLSDFTDTVAVYSTKILIGEYGVEAFDDMVAELESLGLNEGMDQINEWYKAN